MVIKVLCGDGYRSSYARQHSPGSEQEPKVNGEPGALEKEEGEIDAATQEIARNVQEAARGTTEVTSNITGVNQAASETGESAKEVLGATGNLHKQSENLRTEVDRFLSQVRAA